MGKDKPCLGCQCSPCDCYYEQCPDCLKFINHGNLADCCQCGEKDDRELCPDCYCPFEEDANEYEEFCVCNKIEEDLIPFDNDPGEDWPPVELWDDGE